MLREYRVGLTATEQGPRSRPPRSPGSSLAGGDRAVRGEARGPASGTRGLEGGARPAGARLLGTEIPSGSLEGAPGPRPADGVWPTARGALSAPAWGSPEIRTVWSSPLRLSCESLGRNLSASLRRLRGGLEPAAGRGCECPSPLLAAQRLVPTLAHGFQRAWRARHPGLTFLSNVTAAEALASCRCRLAHGFQRAWRARHPGLTFLSNVTAAEDVKVKDLMQDTSRLTGELRSSVHVSDDTIHRILEAGVSGPQVLPGALALVLSGRCDADVLRPLLAFPEDPTSARAARELCGLPGPRAYALVVSLTQNLDLRRLIYKVLMPLEVRRALGALLDVVSRLSQLLPKAGHVLEQLPKFLRTYKVTTLLDVPDVPDFDQRLERGQWRDEPVLAAIRRGGCVRGADAQDGAGPGGTGLCSPPSRLAAPQQGRGGSAAFGSFQFVVKQVCREPASLFSGSNSFMNLPRVTELLGGDKEKFNIPEDATPFCLNLYQEILQSPNGALVWSFLKPILHGKILYTPNIPEINKVIQKANHTFHFVDKLTTLAETLLKISSIFQSGGSGQMLSQLQEALRNKFVRSFVESQLHVDLDALRGKLQTYGGELDKVFARGGAGRIRFLGRVLVNLSSCVALNRFQALESVASLEAKAQELMRHNNFLASIIFNSSLADRDRRTRPVRLPPHITYTIRTSVLYSMRTDLVKNPLWKFHPQNLPADGFKYNYIFVPLQDMIERAIILVQTGREAVEPAVQTQAIPYPCHTRDLFLNNVGFFFPLIMMLTWMVSVASMVRRLVYERQIQIEEYMRMMGVHPTVLFLAWFLENVATLALSSAALAVILKVSGIFAHSNACIVFLFLLDFGVSVVMLSYLLGAFFSRANTAALWASLVYMISFLPYIVLLVLRNQLSVIIQMFLCLLSTTAFGQGVFFVTFLEGQEAASRARGARSIAAETQAPFAFTTSLLCCFQNGLALGPAAQGPHCLLSTTAFGQGVFFVTFLEGQEAGVQWDNLSQPPEQTGMTFSWVCWMILFDSGLYFVCGWYLNNLVPGAFGLRKPWYFPFTASYWKSLCGLAAGGRRTPGPDLSFPPEDSDREGSPRHDGAGAAGGGPPGVALVSVTKEYEPHKAAVRDLSVTFHSDQITALLGTNGAGKTTVISVLTGLHPPTSGAVLVHGRSLHTDLAAIRRELGVCPQRDVLLDNLTVLEHLRLFAAIKAPHWTQRTLHREVNRTLEDVELTRHQHTQTRVLSGGMKRKLSIGLAFLGASRTVVLDEPTSGVDPCSRRGIWDILLKHRRGRTVVFTTHHLDEAEALSDRVAVLQQGRLRFCGPPSCLTEAYGQGLLLTLTKQPSVLGADDPQDLARATALIQSHVPHAFLRDSRRGELVYGLPRDADRARFGALFRALEHNLPRLRLTGFGISDTTLEEVFLTLLQGPKKPSAAERARRDQRPPERARGSCGAPAGTPVAQAAALLVKRLRHTRRAWKGAVSDLLLPVLFVALAMGLFMVRPLATDYPPLELAPGRSDGAEAYFFSSGSDGQELAQVLLRKFQDQDLLCDGLNPDPSSGRARRCPFSEAAWWIWMLSRVLRGRWSGAASPPRGRWAFRPRNSGPVGRGARWFPRLDCSPCGVTGGLSTRAPQCCPEQLVREQGLRRQSGPGPGAWPRTPSPPTLEHVPGLPDPQPWSASLDHWLPSPPAPEHVRSPLALERIPGPRAPSPRPRKVWHPLTGTQSGRPAWRRRPSEPSCGLPRFCPPPLLGAHVPVNPGDPPSRCRFQRRLQPVPQDGADRQVPGLRPRASRLHGPDGASRRSHTGEAGKRTRGRVRAHGASPLGPSCAAEASCGRRCRRGFSFLTVPGTGSGSPWRPGRAPPQPPSCDSARPPAFHAGLDENRFGLHARRFCERHGRLHLCFASLSAGPGASRVHQEAPSPCANASARAPYLADRRGHTLLNLSAFPLEEYLLLPAAKPRLGGWTFGARIPAQDASQPDAVAKVWYNQKGFHSLPSYLNHLNNLILWRHVPAAEDWRRYGITLFSHPYGGALLNEDKIGGVGRVLPGPADLRWSRGLVGPRVPVLEQQQRRQVDLPPHGDARGPCGLPGRKVFYLVSVSLCVAVIVAFQLPAFTFRQNLAATALLLALFGYATLPWMYLMSRIFSSSDVAFISFVSLNFIFGLCTMLMTIMPRLLAMVSRAQNLQKIYDVLKWAFTVLPQFCLGQGLIELCYNQIRHDLTRGFGVDAYVSPFRMDFLGWIFVQLAAQGTALLLLRASLQWGRLPRPRGRSAIEGTVTPSKDIDVEKEQIRVLKGKTSEDLLVLCNLSKSYGSFFRRTTAVRDISLGVQRGECFGLLGPNGAGKSSTFKVLNGDCPPTSGHAVIRTPAGPWTPPPAAPDVRAWSTAQNRGIPDVQDQARWFPSNSERVQAFYVHDPQKRLFVPLQRRFRMLSGSYVRRQERGLLKGLTGGALGPVSATPSATGGRAWAATQAPHQDALDELLTGWEHLDYYCRLRGVPSPSIPQGTGMSWVRSRAERLGLLGEADVRGLVWSLCASPPQGPSIREQTSCPPSVRAAAEVAGDLVERLGLEAHVHQLVATYSGGTRRKLSTALALLGAPDLLLLSLRPPALGGLLVGVSGARALDRRGGGAWGPRLWGQAAQDLPGSWRRGGRSGGRRRDTSRTSELLGTA
nr:ATP-binding cassette sub-family A member 13-like [Vulpes vulpes]